MPQDEDPPKPETIAKERLSRLSQQLSPDSSPSEPHSTKVRGKQLPRGRTDSSLPADWSDILDQIQQLKTIASTPPTSNPGYIRQKNAGKLWVRERIEQLLDVGSFVEVGSITGAIQWMAGAASGKESVKSFTPSNNVQGFGLVGGRKILFTADDFSLRAGHADGATASKTVYMEKLCLELRLPMVKLVDGSSGGGSVTTIRTEGFSYIPPMPAFQQIVQQLDLGIPNVGAVLGPAIGLGAARITACHFSVMAADVGSLFNAGPAVVAKATFEEGLSASDLGGIGIHCANGTIDNAAANEASCFAQIARFLTYVPNCGLFSLPPVQDETDPIERDVSLLQTLISRRRQRAYSMLRIIETTVDEGSFFHIGAGWGHTAFVGLARLKGQPIGIIANNPEIASGAIDALSAQKMVRHLQLCDVFNLPIVQFVDCPGYAVGTTAERQATMKWGVELGKTYYATTVPIFNVIVRKCYGVAGGLMVDCRDPHHRVAWPSGEWGSLPLEGGVEASHSRELREAGSNRSQRYKELMDEYTRLQNPVRSAAVFNIEQIIDPADTRKLLCAWTSHMYESKLPERLRERQLGKIHPVFR